jgi:hypothetical protein
MAKRFNEEHQWVINNWIEARLLEVSMDQVRKKYEDVGKLVIKAVQKEKSELNNCQLHLEQSAICFAKKKWSRKSEKWPPGLWIWNIGLAHIKAGDGEGAWAGIWFVDPKGRKFGLEDLKEARTKIQNKSAKLMKDEKLNHTFDDESDHSTLLAYKIPESRKALARALFDNDSEKFVECMVCHVMILARFIPVLDEILLTKRP